ncbi:MAG: acetate--CoA ligase family protein [Dehalococcoidales bacterium]
MNKINSFFDPKSVALVGASNRPGSIGNIVLENLILGKNKRNVYPINPKYETLLDIKCYPNLASLPEIPELVIITINAENVPAIVEDCAKIGTKSITIISAGFKEAGEAGNKRLDKIMEICKNNGIRLLGPNCLGSIRPGADFSGSFARKIPKPGNIAFLSQSGALGTAVLDWAISREIGFSAFVSLGSMMDVDFGDLIDYFGDDQETKSIIIYMETIGNTLASVKNFMSAARGFARNKPIIVIKPGKFQESIEAAKSHTGALVGDDAYYDAVFNRAGVVRVDEVSDLFSCASLLDSTKLPNEQNVAIITNAGGPAVLATDALIARGGKLSELSPETIKALNEVMPTFWSKANPIDILGDADAERYTKAIEIALKDPGISGIVVIYTPQGAANATDVAKGIVKISKKSPKPILTTMMGSKDVAGARQIFYANKIPTFDFPEEAMNSYLYMYKYARNLASLYQIPEDIPFDVGIAKNHLKTIINNAISKGETLLNEEDSKKFLNTYRIGVSYPFFAENIELAVATADSVGYPIVMKIQSPDISHKSDVGGVVLNIENAKQLRQAYAEMMETVKKSAPKAKIEGVTIQNMVGKYDYELIIGSKKDAALGNVIVFGQGGTEAEYHKDIAIGLPPLNQALARRLIEETKIYSSLSKGFRNKPPVDLRLLDATLIRVSNMIVDFPEIAELDINPLVVSDGKVIALDARIVLDKEAIKKSDDEASHLIITPYPTRYIQTWTCHDEKQVLLRPIRPEDEPLEYALLNGLSEQSKKFRFFHPINEFTHDMLSRFCNIDYDREIAMVAEFNGSGKKQIVGVSRLIIEAGKEVGEFATVIADEFQDIWLGHKLTDMLIGIAREKKLKSIYGIILQDNIKMINLVRNLGFRLVSVSDNELKAVMEL